MERPGVFNNSQQHVIEIAGSAEASTSAASPRDRHFNGGADGLRSEERISGSRVPVTQPSVSVSTTSGGMTTNSRSSSLVRRGDSRRNRSPVHSGIWISVELVLLMSQIVASIVVLSMSRHEHPRTPLFQWIVGYACGCAATLPLLYWRYYHHNHMREQESRQTSPRVNDPSGTLLSSSRTNGGEDAQAASSRSNQPSILVNRR